MARVGSRSPAMTRRSEASANVGGLFSDEDVSLNVTNVTSNSFSGSESSFSNTSTGFHEDARSERASRSRTRNLNRPPLHGGGGGHRSPATSRSPTGRDEPFVPSPAGKNRKQTSTPSPSRLSNKFGDLSDQSLPSPSSLSPESYGRLYPDLAKLSEYPDIKTHIKHRFDPTIPSPNKTSPRTTPKPRSSRPPPTRERERPLPNNQLNLSIFVAVAVIVIAAVAYVYFVRGEPGPDISVMEKFLEGMFAMKGHFADQEKSTWKTFSASVKRIIREEYPLQPSVILMATAKGGRKEADCLARKLAETVNSAFNSSAPLIIDASTEYRSMTPDAAKLNMESKFDKNFNAGSMSVSLLGLEDLDGNAAMLLHSYCDNENARRKRAVFIFTFEVGTSNIPGVTAKEAQKFMEDQLELIWKKQLNVDNANALLSRVANNLVIVKKESGNLWSTFCGL